MKEFPEFISSIQKKMKPTLKKIIHGSMVPPHIRQILKHRIQAQ